MKTDTSSQVHSSFICWARGTALCDSLERILFQRVDGTSVPCDCKCHQHA